MSIKITIPNSSSDVLTFGSGNTPTAAQIAGIDSGSSNGQLALYTTASGTSTERVRVDSSGNVGIGVTPSAWSLIKALELPSGVYLGSYTGSATPNLYLGANNYFNGTNFIYSGSYAATRYDQTAGVHSWFNAASGTAGNAITFTERMRIDSSGNLLVGTTGQIGTEKLGVEQSSATGQSAYFYHSSASYTGGGVIINTARAANTAFSLLNAYSAGVVQFYVGGSGFIYSSQLAGGATTLSVNASGQIIRTPSDASLKTNVQPITYGLDTVMKLKPIKHEWVEEINMGAPSIGFIAQDMELEVPEVVSGEEYKSIDYPKLTAVLTKAIQEQQAIITSLTDRITALENK